MGRLVVRNISNTKKPTSALAEIQCKMSYFVFPTAFRQLCFFIIEYLWWYTNIRNRYIYGYFSHLWTDFDQTKMILSFNMYVLSNLTLSLSLSHNKLFCVAPSATELNYPFNVFSAVPRWQFSYCSVIQEYNIAWLSNFVFSLVSLT